MPLHFDYAIHSSFLIYWTGKDIDFQYNQLWHESDKSRTTRSCTRAYIERLKNILKHGLWMTEEENDDLSFIESKIPIPKIAQTCFTELKLSESRKHARQYGRLGIGVKRPFIFDRFGRPLVYYHNKRKESDNFLKACATLLNNNNDNYLLNYFKSMNSSDILNYDYYGESEWRIIFFESLLSKELIIDPRDHKNTEAYNYFLSLELEKQKKLQYLIPLDCWFSIIIYPSLEVKNIAYRSSDIRKLIADIKRNNISVHCRKDEIENMPIELDLDACRNF
jgi:hypothetical protein